MTDVDDLLSAHDPAIADLSRATIGLVTELLPDPVVSVDSTNIGYGTGPGYRGLVFTVTPTKKHVTLGISHGAALPDPAGLTEGAGRVHKHVKIRTAEDLTRPELRTLLALAVASHRSR
jgi:hypothetical protein